MAFSAKRPRAAASEGKMRNLGVQAGEEPDEHFQNEEHTEGHELPAEAGPSDGKPSPGQWRKRTLWVVGTLVLALGLTFGGNLLRALGRVWVVNDELAKADAIVVLGGCLESRPAGAAELYRRGLAPLVIHMDVRFDSRAGPSEPELTREMLIRNGVPESALVLVGHQVSSTREEAEALGAWVRTNSVKRIILATDIFHTRRARWLFRKQLKGSGTQVQVAAVRNPRYGVENWWRKQRGINLFLTELVKLPYNFLLH